MINLEARQEAQLELEMDQEMNDKIDSLTEKVSDIRSAQRVSTEAFSRHEVANAKDFQMIGKELAHAQDNTATTANQSKERDAEVMQAVKELRVALDAMGKDVDRLKTLVIQIGAIGSAFFFVINNWDKISHFFH